VFRFLRESWRSGVLIAVKRFDMVARALRLATAVVLTVSLAVEYSPRPYAQTSDLNEVVASFYPTFLETLALETGSPIVREQCHAVLQTNASGAPTVIVAGYTNLIAGAVRVLVAEGSGFRVAAEPDGDLLAGGMCSVQRVDVNHDAAPEAHVKFLSNNASVDWIYAWDGQALTNLTPVTSDPISGGAESILFNGSLVDTNGDGVLEAYSSDISVRDVPRVAGQVFHLSGGRYVFEKSVVEVRQFERSTQTPETESVRVPLPAGAQGPFTLRVFNGAGVVGSRVENAVDSGRIWINGQEVVRPNDFGNQVALIERVVTLQSESTLQVRLAGSPGGRISVVIDATSWAP
jgi:hypothetical protein